MPGNLLTIPPSVIATWPTPNYVDPVQRTWLPAFTGTLQATATIFVGTRLWLRARAQAGALGLDDALLVPAYLAATMFTVVSILAAKDYDTNRHIWDVPYPIFSKALLMAWLSEFAFLVSTCCTKISVLLFYRRLVTGAISRRWKVATLSAIAFTAVYCLVFVFTLIFSCFPTEAYWMAYSPSYIGKHYSCWNSTSLNLISGILSVVSDLYSVLLPMGMLRHFEVDHRKKLALNCVFSLGLLVVACGAVRTYYFTALGNEYDITWIGYDVLVWASLETHLALICASAPALRVFFRKYLSDPISRARHTAQSRSANESNTHNTGTVESSTVVSYSRPLEPTVFTEDVEKNFLHPSVKQSSLSTLDDFEYNPTHTTPSEPCVIRTAADFEAYALQNLERNRPPRRAYSIADTNRGGVGVGSTTNETTNDYHAPETTAISWLDIGDT